MEDNSIYRVYDIVEESSSFSGSLGLSDERHNEIADIVSEALSNSDTFSSSAELVTRYANSANDLFFMGVMIGQAMLHQRHLEKQVNGLDGLLSMLKKLKGDED